MFYVCAVAGCTNNSNTGIIFRTFPKINSPEFNEWIKATKNKSLENFNPVLIRKFKRVCNIHFSKTYQHKAMFQVHEMPIPIENLPSASIVEPSKPKESFNKIERTKPVITSCNNTNIKQCDNKEDDCFDSLKQFLNFENKINVENQSALINVPDGRKQLGKLYPNKVKLQTKRMFLKIPEEDLKSNQMRYVKIMNSRIIDTGVNLNNSINQVDSQRKVCGEMENRNSSLKFEPENNDMNGPKIINMQYDFELGQTQVVRNNTSAKLESNDHYKTNGSVFLNRLNKQRDPVMSALMDVDESNVKKQIDSRSVNETSAEIIKKLTESLMRERMMNRRLENENKYLNHIQLKNVEKAKLKQKRNKQLQSQAYYLKKRLALCKEQLTEFQQFQKLNGFVRRFFKTQLNNANLKNVYQTYTFEDTLFAYGIYSRSPICYKFLESIFSLPSETCLNNFNQQVHRGPQLNAIKDLEKNRYESENDRAEAENAALHLLNL